MAPARTGRTSPGRPGTVRPGKGPPRTARPGTGPAGGAGRPWCGAWPGPAGPRHLARRGRRDQWVLPDRKALAAAFVAVPAARPGTRPPPCRGDGLAGHRGTGLRNRDHHRLRGPAAAGGAGARSAAAARREDQPIRNPTNPDPARRPGAGPRSPPGYGPGRAGPCAPGRAERRRPPVAGLAVPVGPVNSPWPARPADPAREMSAVPPAEGRRTGNPVPDPADTADGRGGGARDGRRPRTSRGRVRRHHVPPGTSWRLRIRRARSQRHSILKKV